MIDKNFTKVTILLPFFLNGGVERAMINLSQEMILNNMIVDFVFIDNGIGPLSSEIPKESKIIELHKKSSIMAIPSFIRYLRKERPQIILSALTPANLLAIFGGRFSFIGAKIIIEIQVAVDTEASTSFIKSKLRPFVYKTFFKLADHIIAVSKGIKRDLMVFGISESKIEVIYNPVSSRETILRGNEYVNHQWLIDKKVPVILSIGRLHKQKDFPTLLKAFSLARLKKELRLIILGEGEEKQNLLDLAKELKIEKDVDFVGFVSNPYSYMKNSSLFVLSSAWEGFGNVLAEAMSFGIPLVSTDCPWGPREILEDGKYGELVSVGDHKFLSEAILRALESNHDQKSEIISSERFKTENIFKQYFNLFNS